MQSDDRTHQASGRKVCARHFWPPQTLGQDFVEDLLAIASGRQRLGDAGFKFDSLGGEFFGLNFW
jgi:hypothetical protein